MVDKPVSGTGAGRHAGSTPALCTIYTFLAQLVEQRSFKPQVAGSSPAERTNYEKPLQIFAAVFHLLNGFSVIGHD